MRTKHTVDSVAAYFVAQGCELLSTEYVSTAAPLSYRCSCGGQSTIRYGNFLNGQRCQKCKSEKLSANNKVFSYEDVVAFVEDAGCRVLTPAEEYKDSQTNFRYLCSCGAEGQTTFSSFKQGRRCLACRSDRRAATRRRPLTEVASILACDGYTLLSTEYKNTRTALEFRCPRGHAHTITLSNWMKGYRCRKCYEEDNRGPNHPNWIEDREEKARVDSLRRRFHGLTHAVLDYTGGKKAGFTHEILGYSSDDLYAHLRSFPEWPALQKGNWHLDHIFPIDAFVNDYAIEDPAIINALDNLRPIAGRDNLVKGHRYNKREFERYLNRKGLLPT